MKKLSKKCNFSLIALTAISTLVFNGCSKSSPSTTPVNPYGGDKGQETIWSSHTTTADFPITISVGGAYVGTIGGSLAAEPDCANSTDKVVKFDAEPGTYNMIGKSNTGSWTGTFTIASGSCATLVLK